MSVEGSGPSAIGDYAGRLLDRNAENASLARLQLWEGLERGRHLAERQSRTEQWSKQLDIIQHALPGIERNEAAELLLTVITLCDTWPALGNVDALMAGTAEDRFDKRRTFIVRSVTLLARALVTESPK